MRCHFERNEAWWRNLYHKFFCFCVKKHFYIEKLCFFAIAMINNTLASDKMISITPSMGIKY